MWLLSSFLAIFQKELLHLVRDRGVLRVAVVVPLFQLLLKLAMGPLFALVGVLILQTKLISELRPAEDLRTLVVWATVFGAAQQTVTRFIDQRVSGILGEAPSAAPGPQSKPHAPKREARST